MATLTKELTGHQQQIAEAIVGSSAMRQSLAGLAGTGKTTLVKWIFDQWMHEGHQVRVLAPTGKAANVLRTKGVPAITIHRGIYQYRGKFENDRGETELIFKDNGNGSFCDRLIIDEWSMGTQKWQDDIESRGIPVLYVGDPGQLPPVKAKRSTVLDKPTHILKEIHRQAADNPVIQYAYAVRKGAPLTRRHDGINHVEVRGRGPLFVAEQMIERSIDRTIVASNAQRVALNAAYRHVKGLKGIVDVGDEIICVLNNDYYDVVNGEIFQVLRVLEQYVNYSNLLVASLDSGRKQTVSVWNAQFGQEQKIDDEDVDQEFMLCDAAYAITAHKSQGSGWRHVGVAARGYKDAESKWNYTAVTRAEEELTIFC